MAGLTLRYAFSRDDDDFGWLELDVRTGHFSGRAGFWVQWQDIVEFGEDLPSYPMPYGTRFDRSWGYREEEIETIVLAIGIEPADKRGNLTVDATVADHIEPRQRVSALFTTNYPDLDRFRDEIARMMRREAEEAVLTGRDLP